MKDEFGGIALDSTDEFGGVPAEPATDEFGGISLDAPQAQIPSTRIPSAFPTDAPAEPVPSSPVFKNPDVIAETPGIAPVVGRTVLRDVAPMLAGAAVAPLGHVAGRFVGAAAGARTGALLGALVPGLGETGISEGIGAVLGGLIGGIGSFVATQKAAKAVEQGVADTISKSVDNPLSSAAESRDVAAHPLAAEITDLALMGKPNPLGIIRAARTIADDAGRAAIKDLFTKGVTRDGYKAWQETTDPLLQKQVANVINVAQSGGINAAFNAIDQVKTGNYSFKELTKSALEGALFSSPWIHAKNPATKTFEDAAAGNPAEQPIEQPNIESPRTIIKGIEAKPIDLDTHVVSVNGKDSALLKFVDTAGLDAAQQSVGAKGWEGYFVSQDPATKQPTLFVNRNYIDRQGPIFTHETTHLLDAMGLVTPEQMNSVVAKYGKDIAPEVTARYAKFNAENNLPEATPDSINREVFANIFQNWHENNNAPKVTWIHRAIDFIRNIAGLSKTGRANAQDILAGKFNEPTQEGATFNAPSVPEEKKKITTIVYSGGPANRTRQSVFENVKNVFYGNRGEEFKYIDSGNLDEKGHRIFIPDSITKPDPNWRVTVQPNEIVEGKELPTGYVQIDDVTGGVNKWSSSPEKLAAKGIQVPDFSKLPKGQYSYAEAVKALGENTAGQNPKSDQGLIGEADTARLTNKASSKSGSNIPDRVAEPVSSARINRIRYTIRPNGKFDVHLQTDFEGSKIAGGGTLAMENNLTYEQLVEKVGKNAADSIVSDSGQNKHNDSGWRYGEFNIQPESNPPQFSITKDQTETPEFKRWFEGSKAVDSEGKPLVVYHGSTKAGFNIFYPEQHFGTKSQANDLLDYKRGVIERLSKKYPNFEKEVAEGKHAYYGKNEGIYPVYLSLKNPLRTDDLGSEDKWAEAVRLAEESGHDGLVYKNTEEGNGGDSYVAFNPTQIKSAIGNNGQFDAKNPDIRFSVPKEEPPKESQRDRAQVGGIPRVGQERDTESIAANQEHIRANLFDSTKPVSDEQTSSAWQVFGEMTGPNKSKIAAGIKDAAGGSRSVLGLYKVEAEKYALRLAAATGDDSLMRAIADHSEDWETLVGGGDSTAGSTLRAAREFASDPLTRLLSDAYTGEREAAAQKGAKIDRDLFFKLLKNLRDLKLKPEEVEAAVNEGKLPDGKTIDETLKTVKPKVKPPDETDAEIATQIAKEKLEELRVKYEGAEWLKPEGGRNAVLQVIEDALKGQSRDAEGKIVVGPDGKPQVAPILDVSKPLAESTAEKLIKLGVEPDVAGQIGYQIESARKTEFANRRTKALNAAANSRNIRSLIDSILETPYRAQSDPKWLEATAVDWFKSNGLGDSEAKAAARLFQDQFRQALANASNKIATDLLKKGAPKSYEDLWKMIRAGIFDPTRDWVTKLAEATGWKKPTTEQMVKLQELEHKLTSPELSPEEVANINEQQMRVLRHVGKKDGATLRALGESFTASLLSGIRTFTVQTSPLMMAFRDLPVMIASDPKNAFNFAKAMYNSFKANAVASFKYAWMKDAYGFHLNELEHGFNEMKRISEQTDEVIADKKSTSTQKALAYGKKLYALQRFVFRNLNSLDQASMAVTREWKMAYYTAQAFKEAGLSTSDISQLVDNVEMARRNEFEKAMDEGLDATTAKVRANSRVQDAVWDFVNNKTGNSDLANQVLKASENDTYSTVGRVPKDMSGLDEGLLTRYSGFNDFLQFVSKVRGKGGLQNIGATAMLGMINIPFRTMRYFSDFSPYGLLRYGIYKYRNNRGLDNYWKQTYGNALQARARLWSAIAGTVALGAASAWALKNSTSDEHAGDEDFGLYITGKGPQNRVLSDAWSKRGFKQYSANFVINGRIISIPLTRAGESFLFPFILPAAADDYAWKVKEAEAKGHPLKNKPSAFTSTLIGEALSMTGQSGILQTFGQLQQATENGGSLAKAAVKTGVGAASAVALPFKQLLSSLSEMMVGSLDNSSISSLIANQFPIVGMPFQTPAINRFGDPLYDRSWYGLASRTGVPLAFQIERSDANDRLYTTLVDKGVAPTPLNRSDIEAKYGDLTDDQFKKFATISGQTLKKSVESNLADIQEMPSDEAHKLMGKLSNDANAAAVAALGLQQTAKAQTASNGAQGQPAGNQAHQPKTSKKYSVSRKRKPGSSFYNLRSPHVRALKAPKSKKARTGSLYGLRPRRLYGVNS